MRPELITSKSMTAQHYHKLPYDKRCHDKLIVSLAPLSLSKPPMKQSSGAALLTSIIILFVFSLTLISGTNISILEQKMASYAHEQVKTLHSADSAIRVIMNNRDLMNQAKAAEGNQNMLAVPTGTFTDIAPIKNGTEPSAEIAYLSESPIPNASGSTSATLVNRHFVTRATAEIDSGSRTTLGAGFAHIAPKGTHKRLNDDQQE